MSPRPRLEDTSRRDFEEIWQEGNLDAIDEIYREDYRGHGFPVVDPISRRSYRRFVGLFLRVFSDVEFTLHRLDSIGPFVYTRWSVTATPEAPPFGLLSNGSTVTVDGRGIHRYEGQRVAETWLDFDWRRLLTELAGGVRTFGVG